MDRRRSRLQRDSTKKGNSGGRFGVSTTSLMFVNWALKNALKALYVPEIWY